MRDNASGDGTPKPPNPALQRLNAAFASSGARAARASAPTCAERAFRCA